MMRCGKHSSSRTWKRCLSRWLWLCGVPGGAQWAAAASLSLSAWARGGCRSLCKRPAKLLEATDCGIGSASAEARNQGLSGTERGPGDGRARRESVMSPHLYRACQVCIEKGQGLQGWLLGVIVRKIREGGGLLF